jgi:hypothetical protein
LSVLERTFLDPDKPESVGWALAEALSLMDRIIVIKTLLALEQKERKLPQSGIRYLIGALSLPGRFLKDASSPGMCQQRRACRLASLLTPSPPCVIRG